MASQQNLNEVMQSILLDRKAMPVEDINVFFQRQYTELVSSDHLLNQCLQVCKPKDNPQVFLWLLQIQTSALANALAASKGGDKMKRISQHLAFLKEQVVQLPHNLQHLWYAKLVDVATAVTNMCINRGHPLLAASFIKCAIKLTQGAPSNFTSFHALFARVCYEGKAYQHALAHIDRCEMTGVKSLSTVEPERVQLNRVPANEEEKKQGAKKQADQKRGGKEADEKNLRRDRKIQLKYQEQLSSHLITFYYFKGMILKALKQTRKALSCMQRALAVPLMTVEVSHLTVKAYQQMLLLQELAEHESAQHNDARLSVDQLTHFTGKRVLEAVREPSSQHLDLVDAIDQEQRTVRELYRANELSSGKFGTADQLVSKISELEKQINTVLMLPRDDGTAAERPADMSELMAAIQDRHVNTYLRFVRKAFVKLPVARVSTAAGVVMNSKGAIPDVYFGKAIANSLIATIMNAKDAQQLGSWLKIDEASNSVVFEDLAIQHSLRQRQLVQQRQKAIQRETATLLDSIKSQNQRVVRVLSQVEDTTKLIKTSKLYIHAKVRKQLKGQGKSGAIDDDEFDYDGDSYMNMDNMDVVDEERYEGMM